MEAKDLMIGDLVRVNRDVCIKNDTIVRVCGIDATNRLVEKGLEGSATCVPVDDIDFYSGGIWVKYLEPIPLTPEILEKNGFKEMLVEGFFRLELCKDYDYWCVKDYDYWCVEVSTTKGYELLHLDIEHTCDDIGQGGIDNLKIYYVHELQHALRICGIDKEIVI